MSYLSSVKLPKMSKAERKQWELIIAEIKRRKSQHIDFASVIKKLEAELGMELPLFVKSAMLD